MRHPGLQRESSLSEYPSQAPRQLWSFSRMFLNGLGSPNCHSDISQEQETGSTWVPGSWLKTRRQSHMVWPTLREKDRESCTPGQPGLLSSTLRPSFQIIKCCGTQAKSQQCLAQDFKGFSGCKNSNFKGWLGGSGGEVVFTEGHMHCV